MLDWIVLDHLAKNQQLLFIPAITAVIMLLIAFTAAMLMLFRLDITYSLMRLLETTVIVNHSLQTDFALFCGEPQAVGPFPQLNCSLERLIDSRRNILKQGLQVRQR